MKKGSFQQILIKGSLFYAVILYFEDGLLYNLGRKRKGEKHETFIQAKVLFLV